LTAGGRVLCTVAVSNTLQDAQRKAYEAVQQITFENAQYRKDIADKAFRFVILYQASFTHRKTHLASSQRVISNIVIG
jgi:hypothetical protein